MDSHGNVGSTGAARRRRQTPAGPPTPAFRAAALALGVAAVAAASLAPAAPATAQTWRSVGPPGGWFTGVLGAPSSPDTLYALTYGGAVWSSADRGETWAFAGEPAGQAAAQSVYLAAVDPVASGTLYAVTATAAVKSTDGGVNWTTLLQGLRNLVVAPAAPQVLYGTLAQSGAPTLVERSADGGATWAVAGTLPAAFPTAYLAVSPTAPRTLYAEGPTGFIRSTDGGATWGAAFSPFAAPDVPLGVFAGQGAVVYIAAQRPAGEAGAAVYRSADGGNTWTAADGGLARPLGSLALAPSGNLYAGVAGTGAAATTAVFQSTNGGAAWQQVSAVPGTALLATATGTPDRPFLASQIDGVELSLDQGRTWTAPNRPPSGVAAGDLTAGPSGTSSLYVEVGAGFLLTSFLHSPDGGASWHSLTPIPEGGPPQALVPDAQPGVLYTYAIPALAPSFFSQDDGATWQPFSSPSSPDTSTLLALAADPLLPGKVVRLACPVDFIGILSFGCDKVEVHLTNTFGRGWRLLGEIDAEALSIYPFFIRLDPANPTQAYAMVNTTLYKTVPGSTTLALVPLAGPFVDLAVVPGGPIGAGKPPTLYAALGASRQRVIFKSPDGGATWLPASLELPRNLAISQLLVDPTTDPTTLYILAGQQIYVSADAAGSWHPLFAPGVPTIGSLALSGTLPRTLYASTVGAGVFALTLP